MDVQYFSTLYDYNYWANQRILHAAEGVGGAQFAATVFPHHNSLRGTLVHTLAAEWIWLSRWQGISPSALLREEDFPTLESIRNRWCQEEQNVRTFVAALGGDDLKRAVHYTNIRGKAMAFPLWQLMAHVVNHGTQHRSEAAAMLTELGHSPGDMDLTVFLQD